MSIPNKNHSKKFHAFLLVIFLIAIFTFAFAISSIRKDKYELTRFGVTFSTHYAQQLGLDYQDLYKKIINELKVTSVRLPIYWSYVETSNNDYDWSQVDWLVKFSEENNVKLTIVTGEKVPRWPECFVPDWAEALSKKERNKEVLSFIEETVNRYKGSSALERWQVENEPFFPFGVCQPISMIEFQKRIDLVKALDNHPIQLTVSGELGPWKEVAEEADVLGISLYRKTYNEIFGNFVYPLTPEYYFFRSRLVKEYVNTVIVSELQAEPWFSEEIENRELSEWYKLFNKQDFQNQVEFVKNSHIEEVYFWGVEWWEYLREHGEPALWEEAERVLSIE